MNEETCRRLTRRLHRSPLAAAAGAVVAYGGLDKGYRVEVRGWTTVSLGRTSRAASSTIDLLTGWGSGAPTRLFAGVGT